MRKALLLVGSCVGLAMLLTVAITTQPLAAPQEDLQKWGPNDRNRPEPAIITPGTASTQEYPGEPPSDAIVLFNGKDLSNWESVKDGGPAKWTVGDGYFATVPGTGYIRTKDAYGDCQLHVEWAMPVKPDGDAMEWGNSGVFLLGLYEIQIIQTDIYADGISGAVYGQFPPLVRAVRPPAGEWQSFDIFFTSPRFADGKLTAPAYVTIVLNGVLIQNHQALLGPTRHRELATYDNQATRGPVMLQYHGSDVRFRNIWIRPLETK